MQPIDLSSSFNRDVVRNEEDSDEDSFVGKRQLVVDGYGGEQTHGLPVNRVIGPHRLADYSEPNAVQLSQELDSARIEVPGGFYSGLRVLLANAPQAYCRGNFWLNVTLEYADGSMSECKVHCPRFKANGDSPFAEHGSPSTNMIRKEVREDGALVRSKETALSDVQIPVDASRKLRAVVIQADKSALPNQNLRVNLLALTGVIPM
ncbi:MAG: hypothetical protein AAFX06_09140 [Planctomycetota bacterium]